MMTVIAAGIVRLERSLGLQKLGTPLRLGSAAGTRPIVDDYGGNH